MHPEVTYRLFWTRQPDLSEVGDFIRASLTAELAHDAFSSGSTAIAFGWPGEEVWTANGDARYSPGGLVLEAPEIGMNLRADFISPFALATDTGGPASGQRGPRSPMTPAEQATSVARLRVAFAGIRAVSPSAATFVTTFTKALVIQIDPDMPDSFSSGSSGQYVGRFALWNAHSQGVDEVDVAEGLVHEAIHSVLYMVERAGPGSEIRIITAPTSARDRRGRAAHSPCDLSCRRASCGMASSTSGTRPIAPPSSTRGACVSEWSRR